MKKNPSFFRAKNLIVNTIGTRHLFSYLCFTVTLSSEVKTAVPWVKTTTSPFRIQETCKIVRSKVRIKWAFTFFHHFLLGSYLYDLALVFCDIFSKPNFKLMFINARIRLLLTYVSFFQKL